MLLSGGTCAMAFAQGTAQGYASHYGLLNNGKYGPVDQDPAAVTADADIALDELPFVDLEEVREHSSAESCWVSYGGVVYDVTEFLHEHPVCYRFRGAKKSNSYTDRTDPFTRICPVVFTTTILFSGRDGHATTCSWSRSGGFLEQVPHPLPKRCFVNFAALSHRPIN